MNRIRRPRSVAARAAGQEVHVAGVVDGDDSTAGGGQIVHPAEGDPGSGRPHREPGGDLQTSENRFHRRLTPEPRWVRWGRQAQRVRPQLSWPPSRPPRRHPSGWPRPASAPNRPRRCGTQNSPRRMRAVGVLHLVQQVLHPRMQQCGQFGCGQRRHGSARPPRSRSAPSGRYRFFGCPLVQMR